MYCNRSMLFWSRLVKNMDVGINFFRFGTVGLLLSAPCRDTPADRWRSHFYRPIHESSDSQISRTACQCVCPFNYSTNNIEMDISTASPHLPVKQIDALPFARQDGGGLQSKADWSGNHRFPDSFQVLRISFPLPSWINV
jgi:hypothetical protein